MSTTENVHDRTSAGEGRASIPDPASRSAAMPRELATGDDRAAIHDLISRLGRWLDDKGYADPVETAAILAPDATVSTPGGTASGLVEIAAQARRGHDAHRTHHQITNVIAELVPGDPTRAEIRANLQVVFAPAPTAAAPIGEPLFTLGEVYRFAARRTTDGWRLTRVEIRPVWKLGERPAAAV